jgi:hypothetical protein
MKLNTMLAAAAALVIMMSLPASAHHSPNAFDMTKMVVIKGTLKKIDWINPHVQFHVDVEEGGKVTPWTFEGHPPAWFRKVGVRGMDFQKGMGQAVSVTTNPAKSGDPFGYFQGITFADGSTMSWTYK